jgi:hypothetical protein
MQAHGATLNTLTPSIRWTPRAENKREGNALQQFYSNNNAGGVLRFHGCNVTKQAPTDVLPSASSLYLVLPLPYSRLIPTTGICNRPTSP